MYIVDFYQRSPRGSDVPCVPSRNNRGKFQSSLPVRGATLEDLRDKLKDLISIHAPREGSDRFRPVSFILYQISIHAPREGSDPYSYAQANWEWAFQSTLPVRGATGESVPQVVTAEHFNLRSP